MFNVHSACLNICMLYEIGNDLLNEKPRGCYNEACIFFVK